MFGAIQIKLKKNKDFRKNHLDLQTAFEMKQKLPPIVAIPQKFMYLLVLRSIFLFIIDSSLISEGILTTTQTKSFRFMQFQKIYGYLNLNAVFGSVISNPGFNQGKREFKMSVSDVSQKSQQRRKVPQLQDQAIPSQEEERRDDASSKVNNYSLFERLFLNDNNSKGDLKGSGSFNHGHNFISITESFKARESKEILNYGKRSQKDVINKNDLKIQGFDKISNLHHPQDQFRFETQEKKDFYENSAQELLNSKENGLLNSRENGLLNSRENGLLNSMENGLLNSRENGLLNSRENELLQSKGIQMSNFQIQEKKEFEQERQNLTKRIELLMSENESLQQQNMKLKSGQPNEQHLQESQNQLTQHYQQIFNKKNEKIKSLMDENLLLRERVSRLEKLLWINETDQTTENSQKPEQVQPNQDLNTTQDKILVNIREFENKYKDKYQQEVPTIQRDLSSSRPTIHQRVSVPQHGNQATNLSTIDNNKVIRLNSLEANIRNSHLSSKSIKISHQTLSPSQVRTKFEGIQKLDEETDFIPYKTYIRPYLNETRVIKHREYSCDSRDHNEGKSNLQVISRPNEKKFERIGNYYSNSISQLQRQPVPTRISEIRQKNQTPMTAFSFGQQEQKLRYLNKTYEIHSDSKSQHNEALNEVTQKAEELQDLEKVNSKVLLGDVLSQASNGSYRHFSLKKQPSRKITLS